MAYLSHSKYGINTEVRINNNSNMITGYASTDEADQSNYLGTYGTDASKTLPYNTETGYKASTTENITGVYDMSGGAWEYMASYSEIGSSELITLELSTYGKYLDVYPNSSTNTTWINRILGDATGEMGPFYYYADRAGSRRYHNNWHADFSHFIKVGYPFFCRGGNYDDGVLAGMFYFGEQTGGAFEKYSSRLVLAVK